MAAGRAYVCFRIEGSGPEKGKCASWPGVSGAKMPIPPPPPPGPPPPPTLSQANTEAPKLSRDEQRGRNALLQDICKGAQLKKVTQVNDRSAPILEKSKSGSSYNSTTSPLPTKVGLFQGGIPKLRPMGVKEGSDNSSGKVLHQGPGGRSAAPRPPVCATSTRPQDDTENSRASPPELPRMQRPSLPDLSRPNSASGTGMKHSSSAPPPPPPGRRANAPLAPHSMHNSKAPSYNREKPLPPTPGQRLPGNRDGPPAPPPIKPPPSPVNIRSGPSSQSQSLVPPPPPYRQPPAPPPPPPMIRNGGRDAPPPPPPYRIHGSSDPTNRGKPPPPPTRTPVGPPPPPPPMRNGHRDSISTVRSYLDDFESKYSFHPVEDFPAPEEFKYFQRIYPSKTNRATRGAPPLPPVPRKFNSAGLVSEIKEGIYIWCFPVSEKGQVWIEYLLLNTVVYTAEESPMGIHLSFSLSPYKSVGKQIPTVEMPNSGLDTTKQTLKQKQTFPLILSHALQVVVTSSLDCFTPIMPSTRSQSQSQKTINFPKRKSVRTLQKSLEKKKGSHLDPATLSFSLASSPKQVLPLSPRKRLGDDNLCNVAHLLPCTPTKQSKKENILPATSPRTLLFNEHSGSRTPTKCSDLIQSPIQRSQETPTTMKYYSLKKERVRTQLFKPEGTCYQQAKSLLHTAVPDQLLAREKETSILQRFLLEHVCRKKPGSLYISGAPGTGKTACLNRALLDLKTELTGIQITVLNCMALRSSQAVFPAIAEQLGLAGTAKAAKGDVIRKLEKWLTSKSASMALVVLDEMDQLDSKGQDVLYTVFEWPSLPNSRLILIGIANALDLTDRILPRLQTRPLCRPQLLNFSPYSKDQLASILQERLKKVSGEQVLDNAAIQFCARKVSAFSGDARKALDICRRAVEIVESDVKTQSIFKQIPAFKSHSKAAADSAVLKRVGLCHISQVISDVYGDRMATGSSYGDASSFPLQQKILVCSLLLLAKQKNTKEVNLGKLHEAYSRICQKQKVGPVDQSECLSLSALLESRGIVGLKKAKEARLSKVFLKIEEKDVEHALKDGILKYFSLFPSHSAVNLSSADPSLYKYGTANVIFASVINSRDEKG
ncbi:Cell division control protein 6-like protein, partial [Ophiophagus hannah]